MPITSERKFQVAWGLLLSSTIVLSLGVAAEEAVPAGESNPATDTASPAVKASDQEKPLLAVDSETAATFIKAARFGQQDTVKSYLDRRLSVTVTDYLGDTALIAATSGGYDEIVQMLLAAGAPVNAANQDQRTALMAAALRGDVKLVRMLLVAGAAVNAKDKQGETALFDAVRYGRLDVVRLLLDAGADPDVGNRLPVNSAESGYTPLMYAAKRGLAPNAPSVQDSLDMVRALLAKGANPDTRSTRGTTALSVAQDYGNPEIAKLLLQGGAKEVLTYTGLDLNDALLLAASHGDAKEVVESLNAGADPHSVSRTGVTPLLAAAYGGNVGAVRVLVERGAQVNEVPNGFRAWTWTGAKLPMSQQALAEAASLGDTALILAAQLGHEDIVAYLLDHGANPALANPQGDTPLSLAAEQGHARIVAKLLAKGSDPNEGQQSAPAFTGRAVIGVKPEERNLPLSKAAQGGHKETVAVLLEKGADPNRRGFAGKTALFWAVERGYADVVELLLDHNADPNIDNTAGQTPLMEAAKAGRADLVRALLAHHADLNAREGDDGLPGTLDVSAGTGMTPLMLAVVGGHVEVVNALLQAGADVSLSNRGGQNALDVAKKGGNADIVALLRSASAFAGQ